jgi:hypothetical protein
VLAAIRAPQRLHTRCGSSESFNALASIYVSIGVQNKRGDARPPKPAFYRRLSRTSRDSAMISTGVSHKLALCICLSDMYPLAIRDLASLTDSPNPRPTLTQYDQWGKRVDILHTSEGWRRLKGRKASSGQLTCLPRCIHILMPSVQHRVRKEIWGI